MTIDKSLLRSRIRYLERGRPADRKSTRLNSSHSSISYAVFCLKKKRVIPAPDLWLPRLTHGRHVLERLVVLLRVLRADLAVHRAPGWRGVERDEHGFLGDLPGA